MTINLKDEDFNITVEIPNGPTASDVIRAFTGIMMTDTFCIKSIRNALIETADELNEQIKICDEADSIE